MSFWVVSFSAGLGTCCLWMSSHSHLSRATTTTNTSQCEAVMLMDGSMDDYDDDDNNVQQSPTVQEQLKKQIQQESSFENASMWTNIQRVVRMMKRIFKLILVFTPVAALYPIHCGIRTAYYYYYYYYYMHYSTIHQEDESTTTMSRGDQRNVDAQQMVWQSLEQHGQQRRTTLPPGWWYYRLLLRAVEWSGAALIKIMQWAGSRPDMFGPEFCAVFSQLQDDTTPHAWKHTEIALRNAYGDEWSEHLEIGEILGSGCIAQVYKGNIKDKDFRNKDGRPIAIKVMHPNVQDDIDADLDILRVTVRLLENLKFGPLKDLKWLNLPGFIEEMAVMLKIQLDLRTEGNHLVQFNENFKGNDTVVFPKLIQEYPPVKNVLIETFCEGVPVMEFVHNNKADPALLTKMCTGAIQAVCQMIFLDNFTHGDLHPGNVLVSKNFKFILLDVGIVTQHSPPDHRLISDVLAAFIRCDGRKAGKLMIEDSDTRLAAAGDHSVDEEGFLNVIENITVRASGKEYLMQHLGTYITMICNAASTHHVMLNQAFVSAALAVKVQEGIALALDPSIEIWKIAIPIILEGERRYRTDQAMGMLSWENIVDWLSGGKLQEQKAIEERKRRAQEYNLTSDTAHRSSDSNDKVMVSN